MEKIKTPPSTLLVVIAFATVYIVWGSTYFFIQRALSGFPPLLLGAIRFFAAGFIMLVWSIANGEKVWMPGVKVAMISGVLLLFVGNGAVIWVEQFMPTAMVAIIISSTPIWFVVLDKPKWKENFSSPAIIGGLAIGFCGVLLLFGERIWSITHSSGHKAELGGMLLLILGAMCWAGGSLYSKYKSTNVPATVSSTWQMMAAGIAFLIPAIVINEPAQMNLHNIPLSAWLSLLYLVLFGSIAGFSAYVWLLKVRPATQVSTYAYVNPVVAVLLGVIFSHETVSTLQIAGLAVILASVFMINMVKRRKEKIMQKQKQAAVI